MKRNLGFTLIELMMTVTIAAILLGIGVPSMSEFVTTNRRAAAVNMLVSDMQRARGFAITRRVRVVLCPSSDGVTCLPATTRDWSGGWLLFSDPDDDLAPGGAQDQLLNTQNALKNLKMPSSTGRFEFTAGGGVQSTFGGRVAICVDSDNTKARTIVVDGTGRTRLVKGSDELSCT